VIHPLYELRRLGADFHASGISARARSGRRLPAPRYVLWDSTRRCNLKCSHCGAASEQYGHELTTAQVRALIDELAALRVDMFAVTGGEPLLRPDLLDLLDYAHHAGLKTGIATNGFLIDAGKALALQQASATSVQVSLDGLASTHSRVRGHPQAFDRALSAIGDLLGAGIPLVSAATTVTPQNLDELDGLRQLLDRSGVHLWRLGVVMPIGRARQADLTLQGDGLRSMLDFASRNSSQRLRILVTENLPFLGGWEKRLRGAPQTCPVGWTAACIGVTGQVRGCPEMPDATPFQEGSILERRFDEIWQNGFQRYRQRSILKDDPVCRTCLDADRCFGGCWVMRLGEKHCIHELLAE
jgi:radical SAM protein with 4Fe4S-binding SPASM domain